MRKMPLEIKDKKLTATCTILYPIQVCIKIYNASVEMEITGYVIIVAFLENATIGYSLESLCVCVFVCVCFCTITRKEIDLGTRNWNTL